MTRDSSGWRRIATHSSASSLPGLSRMRLETPSLPTSCSRPARRSRRRVGASSPMVTAMALGDLGHARGVAGGVRRLRVDDPREGLGDAVQAGVVGALHAVGGLQGVDVGLVQRGPEGAVVLEAGDRIDQRGLEPRAAALARHRAGGGRAALRPEDLHRLGQAHHARKRGDELAGQPARVAVPVPVLVELVDGAGRVLVEVDRASDVGAALAAQLPELARAVGTHDDEGPQMAGALQQRRAGGDRAAQGAQRLHRLVGIDEPALALDRAGRRRRRPRRTPPTWSSSRRP